MNYTDNANTNFLTVFGGKVPLTQPIQWHGIDNYAFLLPVADDPVTITDLWDGTYVCTYVSIYMFMYVYAYII